MYRQHASELLLLFRVAECHRAEGGKGAQRPILLEKRTTSNTRKPSVIFAREPFQFRDLAIAQSK